MASMYSPFRGCRKCSEGCLHCYIHKGDAKRNVDTSKIVRTSSFYKPIERKKNGEYKMKSSLVYTCFQTDFLIEEADQYREEIWQMINERKDCDFLFLTKRIERMANVLPSDWNEGYDNVIVGLSIENQRNADKKIPAFLKTPIKHRILALQAHRGMTPLCIAASGKPPMPSNRLPMVMRLIWPPPSGQY